jgi:hypothetical protein
MCDTPDLSQRVNSADFSIQFCGDPVATELFMYRRFVVKRENTAFPQRVFVQQTTTFLFCAYIFETA